MLFKSLLLGGSNWKTEEITSHKEKINFESIQSHSYRMEIHSYTHTQIHTLGIVAKGTGEVFTCVPKLSSQRKKDARFFSCSFLGCAIKSQANYGEQPQQRAFK